MQVVFRMSAIVAALAVSAAALLSACGQRGPLYMPTVPPLPARPASMPPLDASAPVAASPTSATPVGDIPDTSGQPLSLAPDESMQSPASAPLPASASADK